MADNCPGFDREVKFEEAYQGLSTVIAAQIATQILAAIGPVEIPVLPNLDLPDRFDEFGHYSLGAGLLKLSEQLEAGA